jgi:hypothetical protein
MKKIKAMAVAGALMWLVGCASPSRVTVLEPIGPSPRPQAQNSAEGRLKVYSARTVAEPDMAAWQWDSEFGRNQILKLQYNPAHSDYAIYTQGGALVRRVSNARDASDGRPTVVSLAPGTYEVRALAEAAVGSVEVGVPVVVQSGRTTGVHLVRGWKPHGRYTDREVVRLPNGQIAGWLAAR